MAVSLDTIGKAFSKAAAHVFLNYPDSRIACTDMSISEDFSRDGFIVRVELNNTRRELFLSSLFVRIRGTMSHETYFATALDSALRDLYAKLDNSWAT